MDQLLQVPECDVDIQVIHASSVSDLYHFDADPYPDPRIRFRDDGSYYLSINLSEWQVIEKDSTSDFSLDYLISILEFYYYNSI